MYFFLFLGVNEVDYSLYPNRKLQEQWLRSYLEAYKEYKGFGTEVSEKEVEVLYVQVNQFALVNNKHLISILSAIEKPATLNRCNCQFLPLSAVACKERLP